jgi:hypothetical protein
VGQVRYRATATRHAVRGPMQRSQAPLAQHMYSWPPDRCRRMDQAAVAKRIKDFLRAASQVWLPTSSRLAGSRGLGQLKLEIAKEC